MTLSGAGVVLYSFDGFAGADGASPTSLIDVKGKLYGTTYQGGTGKCGSGASSGCGTVFSITP